MKLAIFDFDGTLVPKDTLPFVLRQWKKQKYSKVKYYKTNLSMVFLYIRYKLGINLNMTPEEIRSEAVKKFNCILEGMKEEEIDKFFYNCSEDIKMLLDKNIISEVEKCRSAGYHTVLLSGAHYNLLKYVGDYLKFDTVIGTQLNFSNNILDSDKEVEVISGGAKKKKILEYFHNQPIDWNISRAYADSYSDLELLELTGQPIAVKPDKKLKAIAIEKNWKIIN